jgi:hypothetical protein
MPDLLIVGTCGMDDIGDLTQPVSEVEFRHRLQPGLPPFILTQTDKTSRLDKEARRRIRPVQHLDDIGRNVAEWTVVDDDSGVLDRTLVRRR